MLLVISTFVVFQFIYNLSFKSFLYFRYISGHLPSVLLIFTLLYFRSFAFWSSKSSILLLYFRSSAIFASSHLYFVLFQVLCFLCFWSYEYCYTVFQAICKLDDDAKILGSYPLDDGHRIHVEDNTK